MSGRTQILTDLDALCAPPRQIRAGGRTWTIPGSPPVTWMLAGQQLEEKAADPDRDILELIEERLGHVADLLLVHQPDQEEEIRDALGALDVGVLFGAVMSIYSAAGQEEPETARPPRAGTTSTKRKPKPRSRSGSRSSS